MSDPLEQKYHRFNLILSVVIGALLATVGGLFLYQNKDFKFSSISPAKWMTDQALKSDPGLPKFEAVKGMQFDTSKPINWQGVLNDDQIKKFERDFGKFQGSTTKYQPPPIRVPSYQPPAFRR